MSSNCDVINIFANTTGGAEVTINNKTLTPSPFISITQEKYTNGNQVVGGIWRINLNGTIVKNSFDDVSSEVRDMLMDDTKLDTGDCVNIVVKCSGTFINGFGRITSMSFDEGNQPYWVNIAPYNIEIELYTNDDGQGTQKPVVKPSTSLVPTGVLLSSYDESFSVSIGEDAFNWDSVPLGSASPSPSPDIARIGNQHIIVTFNISATGISGNSCSPSPSMYFGLDAADRAITARLSDLRELDLTSLTDVPDTPTASQNIKDHLDSYTTGSGIALMDFRNVTVNPVANSIEVSGELIIRPSGCSNPNLFTTMNVEETVDGDGRTVTISGTVKAVFDTNIDINEIIKYNKFNCNEIGRMATINNFLNALSNNKALLQNIAAATDHKRSTTEIYLVDNCALTSLNDPCVSTSPPPSPSPPLICDMRLISSQLGRDYGSGTGNFSFVLSNKSNCTVLGAKKIDIEITHDKPADNIVEIIVPGRGDKGVLIQNICCKTAEKYSIRVNASLNSNLCGYNDNNFDDTYNTFENCIQNLLSDLEKKSGVDVTCWFLVQNSKSIGNNTYSLNRQYVKPSCP